MLASMQQQQRPQRTPKEKKGKSVRKAKRVDMSQEIKSCIESRKKAGAYK